VVASFKVTTNLNGDRSVKVTDVNSALSSFMYHVILFADRETSTVTMVKSVSCNSSPVATSPEVLHDPHVKADVPVFLFSNESLLCAALFPSSENLAAHPASSSGHPAVLQMWLSTYSS